MGVGGCSGVEEFGVVLGHSIEGNNICGVMGVLLDMVISPSRVNNLCRSSSTGRIKQSNIAGAEEVPKFPFVGI